MKPRLKIVSGVDGKLPACFLVETGDSRILLDLGEGPEPGVRPDTDALSDVDAIVVSHAHEDHAAALDVAQSLGNPLVYATPGTWSFIKACPVPAERRRTLSARDVLRVAVAAERYRLKNGSFPAKAADLVPDFLPAVPIDPCDGQPLRFKATAEELIVYSVGKDGVDNGGQETKPSEPDIVVRVPAKKTSAKK